MKQSFNKISNYEVSKLSFDSTTDLSNYIKKAKPNDIFNRDNLSSSSPKEDDWRDFDSFEDAVNALEFGTDLYFENFKREVKKVNDFISKNEKNKLANYKNDIIGFMPIVPNAIIGNPINMINYNVKPKPYPTARIILEKVNSCGVSAETMNGFYSIVFVLIQLLEKRGIRCELWVSANFKEGSEIVSCKTKLKNFTQPLNMYKIQFPIIATDYLRRIMFRILETDKNIRDTDWRHGYGHPMLSDISIFAGGTYNADFKKILDLNDDDIYIPSCQKFNYSKNDGIDNTISHLINKTNLKKYIKLNKEVII